ncbi:FMN-binding protein MioC [Alteromonadaceae bacterium BrNp21-10]|nr:FMN-binding protein MioC [Alteromonadaceae bacterium BrNp21-10]
MQAFEIIVGSMLGASEYVADELSEKLNSLSITNNIHLKPDLKTISTDSIWCICTSTHGAGDLPDNIQAFAKQLKNQHLTDVRYCVIGLGDSSYDTFCQGAKTMQLILQEADAKQIGESKFIDVLFHPIPEEEALIWFEETLLPLVRN